MHLKNFSLILTNNGWSLAPAYDLLNVTIANPDDHEELALTLEGKRRKLQREHFERLGKGLGLTEKQAANCFSRLFKNRDAVYLWLEKSFMSPESKRAYRDVMEARYAILS